MFAKLKSILSSHIAPGAACVNVRPFSFPWGMTINCRGSASRGDEILEELAAELDEVYEHLEADRLREGRERVASIIAKLEGMNL